MKVTIEESEKSIALDCKAIEKAADQVNTDRGYNLGLQIEPKKESPIDSLEIQFGVNSKEDFDIPASDESGKAFDGHSVGNFMERGKRIYRKMRQKQEKAP